MHAGDRTCLESDEWFASLRSSRREDILTHARSSTLPPGALIYGMSDPPNGLWAVLEGQVQLKGYPTPGLEFLAMTVGPGRWFGELSVLDGGPRPHDATVSVSSRLLHLPVAAVHALGETSPDFYLDLARLACRHQRLARGVGDEMDVHECAFAVHGPALCLGTTIEEVVPSRAFARNPVEGSCVHPLIRPRRVCRGQRVRDAAGSFPWRRLPVRSPQNEPAFFGGP